MAIENMEFLNPFFTSSEMIFRLVRFATAFAIGIILTRLTATTLSKRVLDLKKYSTHRISNIIQLIGFSVSLVVALEAGQFGNLLTVVGTLAAALTVAIGFGMREEVANYVAGIFIHMQNPYVKGDYIKIGDEQGRVKEIGMRATVLNESTRSDVIVPNSKIDSNPVRNYTRGTKNYASIIVSVDNEDVQQAEEILLESASSMEKILERPEPEVKYLEIEEKVKIKLNYTVKGSPVDTRSRIISEFNRKAVEAEIYGKDEEEK
ncbi:mechanosensitive ion channel family protein [Candidatus Nanohalococcus occultus]|uniref:mechanosensitive ion channel family protein n=1 Tax=Candidatus Nanohalococcus occultus TaxID=2978047 RepID=UPI0039E01994